MTFLKAVRYTLSLASPGKTSKIEIYVYMSLYIAHIFPHMIYHPEAKTEVVLSLQDKK